MAKLHNILDRMAAQELATAHLVKCKHAERVYGEYVVMIGDAPKGVFNDLEHLIEVLENQIATYAEACKTKVFFASGEELNSQDITEALAGDMARVWFNDHGDCDTDANSFPAFIRANDGGVSDDLISSADACVAGQADLRSHYRASVL